MWDFDPLFFWSNFTRQPGPRMSKGWVKTEMKNKLVGFTKTFDLLLFESCAVDEVIASIKCRVNQWPLCECNQCDICAANQRGDTYLAHIAGTPILRAHCRTPTADHKTQCTLPDTRHVRVIYAGTLYNVQCTVTLFNVQCTSILNDVYTEQCTRRTMP